MDSGEKKRSKHGKSHDKSERSSKRRHKYDESSRHSKKAKSKHVESGSHIQIVDDDPDEEDMWVEKNIDMDGERVLATDIPTAESLQLTSKAMSDDTTISSPPSLATETPLKRDDWMLPPSTSSTIDRGRQGFSTYPQISTEDESLTEGYGEPSVGGRTLGGDVDFFSSMGTEVKKKPRTERPDPNKPVVSSRELNLEFRAGQGQDDKPPPPPPKNTPGGPGSNWRMMRLRKVYETAEEEGRPVEAVAVERFDSLDAFEEAREERRILDEREGTKEERGRRQKGGMSKPGEGERGFMFSDIPHSGASSRSSSFRRPGAKGDTTPSTPSPPSGQNPPANKRIDSLRLPSQASSPLAQSHTPIPSVMTPPITKMRPRAMSPSSLNKLQAKVLRAKLIGTPDAESLEREYEAACHTANNDDGSEENVRTTVEVLPTLDGRGRLYDVGHSKDDEIGLPGNRKAKEKVETRDPKTGDIIRYNADDDTTTLGELLRQEKFGGGMADQKDLDAQFAKAIMGDGKFENDLEYMDDNAERLGRQKMRSDAMKRQFAIHDYKKTQKVLASCHFCFGEDDSPPKAPVISMGTRVYLSCTTTEELVKEHCLIVPIQHHLNMLEGDDDVWDEVRNFMKCLMRMFAEEDKGVVFYETVISLKWQKHTCIECVPLPWDQLELLPGYFKESILTSEAEWSQHKKLIDFSARPGGFRRAMVPNLPYFMVQFDYKGEKGYGHVIEGTDAANGEEDMDDRENGGGEFPRYFAAEIIGNLLDIEVRKWRKPKRIDSRTNKERVSQFKHRYDKFDWTEMIGRQ